MADPLDQYDDTFKAAGQEWNVDWRVLKAMAAQESRGDPNAVSKAGAVGLMQIMPDTGAKLGMTNLRDPAQSIYGAAKYMNQALEAEKDNPAAALLYYHGGPGWRQNFGPESRGYVPAVAGHYQRYAKADTGTATDAKPAPAEATPVAQAQKKQDDDPFTKALNAPASTEKPAAAPAKADEPDAFTKALGPPQAQETADQKPGTTTARGVARNVAAGVLEGEGGVINMLSDPFGNLIARPLLIAGGTAFDAIAHGLGYQGMTPEQRADLYGDDKAYPQPGTAAINALANPGDVTPNSEAERLVRKAATTGTMLATVGPTGVRGIVPAATVGAGGGMAGDVAAQYVPEWAQPATEFAGNVLGGFGTMIGLKGAQMGSNALASGVTRFAEGPPTSNPLAPPPPSAPVQPAPSTGPVDLNQLTGAVVRATPPIWRPVAPGEEFTPGREYRMNQATGQREVNVGGPSQPPPAVPPQAVGPSAGMGGPQSGGAAATPSAAATMTPEEIANNRTVANKQWLNNPVQPGIRDTNADIPGITLNLAEQEQTVQAARELKALKLENPELTQEEKIILDRNTRERKAYLDETIGSDITRAGDLKRAEQKIETDLATVWRGKGEADPAGVHTQIETELNGSAGDLPPLKSAMQQVKESLEQAGTDPQAMYRTHRLINYLQSREGQRANPGYGANDVQAALTRVKAALKDAIEPAAPGFKKAMSDYAEARGPIDAAKALQDRENGLYDTRGHMTFGAVHKLLRDIIEAQRWDAPDHPFQFVSDEQMQRLQRLHDNLKRVASAQDLAAARGSDTAQNLVDIAKGAAKAGVSMAAHAAANKVAPVAGSFVVNALGQAIERGREARLRRFQMRRGREMLQPSENLLQQPPQPPP